jgi:hypothetical protein
MRVQQEFYPKPWPSQPASCGFDYNLLKKKKRKNKSRNNYKAAEKGFDQTLSSLLCVISVASVPLW